jgi:hypothetical protein
LRGLDPRLRGLGNLARKVSLDRNARGMPKQDRLKIKTEARPHLRLAIHYIRKSRDALLAGDIALHECERDRARMYAAFARLEFFQPYANTAGERYAKLAELSETGGKAKADEFARARPGLEELDKVIRGFLARGDRMRVEAWMLEYSISRSAIYRRIGDIKKEAMK